MKKRFTRWRTGILLAGLLVFSSIASTPMVMAAEGTNAQKLQDGSFAYFEDEGATDALDALNNSKYAELTIKGDEADATSFKNMLASFQWIKECNRLREENGLDPLLVNDKLMAMAQADANFSDTIVAHAQQFNVGENCAWNYGSNPFKQWYDDEKAIYDQMEEPGWTSETGHYLNIINASYKTTGFAISTRGTMNGWITYTQVFSSYSDDGIPVEEYEQRVLNYYNSLKGDDNQEGDTPNGNEGNNPDGDTPNGNEGDNLDSDTPNGNEGDNLDSDTPNGNEGDNLDGDTPSGNEGDNPDSDNESGGNSADSDNVDTGAEDGNTDSGSDSNTNNTDNSGSNNNSNNNSGSTNSSKSNVANIGTFTANTVPVDWAAAAGKVAEKLATDETSIHIYTGTSYTVPAALMDSIRGTDKALVLNGGNGLAISVQAVDIKKAASDLKIDLLFEKSIPDSVKSKVAGTVMCEFSMADKSAFPFKIDVHVSLGTENAGKVAKLYRYDESKGKLVLAGRWTVTESGQAMFPLVKGDEYFVVLEEGSAADVGSGTYTVVPGDYLSAIAKKNGTTVNKIMELNPQIKNADRIYAGWVITLP